VWYDPSDLTTLFQDSAGTVPVTTAGQTVGKMLDKSGRGNHATQATAGLRPTYQVDTNGHPYLLFDGIADYMVTGTITPGTNKVQAFAGVRKLVETAGGNICEFSPSTGTSLGSFRLIAPTGLGANNYGFTTRGSGAGVTPIANTYTPPITNVVTGIGDISAPNAVIRVDGAVIATITTTQGAGNYLAYPLYIGSRAGTSLFFSGNLYGLIARFGPNLSSDQISSTEGWINNKTGAY
jgi:hypothetical protein